MKTSYKLAYCSALEPVHLPHLSADTLAGTLDHFPSLEPCMESADLNRSTRVRAGVPRE